MRAMSSLFFSNEELGKKDDDHKPTKFLPVRSPWSIARIPPRKALKRFAIALVVGALVYVFVHNIPTDVGIRDHRRPVYPLGFSEKAADPPKSMPKLRPLKAPDWNRKPTGSGTGGAGQGAESDPVAADGYDGPIQFKKLASSLHSISGTRGDYPENKNILFAASSLQSAALLLPVACQMGAELRSYVHFALMSKSEISVEELQEINGIDEACHIIFHDARPDYAAASTDERFAKAVVRGAYHINFYMHPQAVIVDGTSSETSLFLEAIRVQVNAMNVPLIELPENIASLSWVTKLDSSSLAAWHKLTIDILIQAAPGTSGNLIRLLKSLAAADFGASAIPHLTIELPNKVDRATASFLETFQWPPATAHNPTHAKQLTLRHRIPRSGVTEEESSIRFLESFWPVNPRYSHVLVLSPQVELSPWFFHYIKYSVLEYMHSNAARTQQWDSRLLGISLDLPKTHLDATKPFTPPPPRNNAAAATAQSDDPTAFLWQAPNSNAVLYTGERWMELHAFVSRLLDLQRGGKNPLPSLFIDKLVSKRYPSWLEHALKLSRARGYWTLYPSRLTARNLAVVHRELYRAPEEYGAERTTLDGEVTAAGRARRTRSDEGGEGTLAPGLLVDSLPAAGVLPPFNEMPLLLWDGPATTLSQLDASAAEYATEFRRAVGGCEALTAAEMVPRRSARDLFCVAEE